MIYVSVWSKKIHQPTCYDSLLPSAIKFSIINGWDNLVHVDRFFKVFFYVYLYIVICIPLSIVAMHVLCVTTDTHFMFFGHGNKYFKCLSYSWENKISCCKQLNLITVTMYRFVQLHANGRPNTVNVTFCTCWVLFILLIRL